MSSMDAFLCVSFLMLGVAVGVMGALGPVRRMGVRQGYHATQEWVETCWPNKPVWTEGPGVCWVNGQKVVVE